MAGLSRLIAKELSSALGITDNPKFNPMFKQTKDFIRGAARGSNNINYQADGEIFDVANPDSPIIASFYSPVESAIENAPISETRGTRGENIEAFVRKRAPKVSKSEMEFREFNLDSEELYTKGQALQESMMEPMEISALRKPTKYESTQRQDDLVDIEVGYEEVGVDVTSKDLGLMTHYGSSNLAHTRYSLRQNRDALEPLKDDWSKDADYIFIEELQSDAIQNMSDNPRKALAKATEELRVEFKSNMDDIAFKPEFDLPGTLFEDYEDFVFNKYLPIATDKKLSGDQTSRAIQELFKDQGFAHEGVNQFNALKLMFEAMMDYKTNVYNFSGKDNILGQVTDEVLDLVNETKRIVSKKDTPLTSLTDSVRVLLQSIIADAKGKGIDEIVLPPIEKLAASRFPVDSDEYRKAITKGSGFHNTYVVAFDKALKQLKAELGDQVKVGTKDLKYETYISPKDRQLADRFPNGSIARRVAKAERANKTLDSLDILKGKSINIKDLKLDPTRAKLRLNKGGLVQRPNK
jgi:hypothetical protein